MMWSSSGLASLGRWLQENCPATEGRIAILEKKPRPAGVCQKGPFPWSTPRIVPPGTLKGKLCLSAPERFKRLSEELQVTYREMDELWLALEPSQIPAIEDLLKEGARATGERGLKLSRVTESGSWNLMLILKSLQRSTFGGWVSFILPNGPSLWSKMRFKMAFNAT